MDNDILDNLPLTKSICLDDKWKITKIVYRFIYP